jgi:cold shock CspA family protein
VIATVREWRDEDGWGILDAEVGDVFVHFSNIEMKSSEDRLPDRRLQGTLPLPETLGPHRSA